MSFYGNDFLGINGLPMLKNRGITVFSSEQVDSTNSQARREIISGNAVCPALFLANSQTAGRGRMGRSFFSPSDTGIYMSMAFDITDCDVSSVTRMTSATAVAVCRAIQSVTGLSPRIKWVNDLYLDGKKICGILAESFFACERRYAVIGIGVNISTDSFPEQIEGIAGSLGCVVDVRRELVSAMACGLFDTVCALQEGDASYMDDYRTLSCVLGKTVEITAEGITKTGVATAVEDDGALRVALSDGSEILLSSGEISLRLR